MNRLSCSQLSYRRDSSPLKKKKRRSGRRGACVLLQVDAIGILYSFPRLCGLQSQLLESLRGFRDCVARSCDCLSLCAVFYLTSFPRLCGSQFYCLSLCVGIFFLLLYFSLVIPPGTR